MFPRATQPFILLSPIKRVPAGPGDLVGKSKLSPSSDSVALRQLNPIHKKEPSNFFKLIIKLQIISVFL